ENAAPFEGASGGKPCTPYNKFGAFALLNHGGDFKAAARDLAGQGYGDQGRDGRPKAPAASRGAPQGLRLGDLTLLPGQARRTPAGVVRLNVSVYRGGKILLHLTVSSTPSSLKGPTRLLAQAIGAGADKAMIEETLA